MICLGEQPVLCFCRAPISTNRTVKTRELYLLCLKIGCGRRTSKRFRWWPTGISPRINCAGILEQSMGARNRVGIGLSYRPARLRRLAEAIPERLCKHPKRRKNIIPPPFHAIGNWIDFSIMRGLRTLNFVSTLKKREIKFSNILGLSNYWSFSNGTLSGRSNLTGGPCKVI